MMIDTVISSCSQTFCSGSGLSYVLAEGYTATVCVCLIGYNFSLFSPPWLQLIQEVGHIEKKDARNSHEESLLN